MITTAELHRCATRDSLRFDQAEKDYVILLLLSALSARADGEQQWFFKGGTCLRHCYYPGYRFSELGQALRMEPQGVDRAAIVRAAHCARL